MFCVRSRWGKKLLHLQEYWLSELVMPGIKICNSLIQECSKGKFSLLDKNFLQEGFAYGVDLHAIKMGYLPDSGVLSYSVPLI